MLRLLRSESVIPTSSKKVIECEVRVSNISEGITANFERMPRCTFQQQTESVGPLCLSDLHSMEMISS